MIDTTKKKQRPPVDVRYPEIKTRSELGSRKVISIDRVLWSPSRQKVICRITSQLKKGFKLNLKEIHSTSRTGTVIERKKQVLETLGKPEKHIIKLDLLRQFKGDLYADFLQNLILKELKYLNQFTDPNYSHQK
jgi:hypothetical protein